MCKRTILADRGYPIKPRHYSISDIKKYFDPIDMKGFWVNLSGVLGDPIACPDLYDISEYFMKKEIEYMVVSTNAGLKTMTFWKRYGELSNKYEDRIDVHFAIDGLTRNDYRVGVNLKKVWNNVNAYLDAGGKAVWQYIIFDYNKHEIEEARKLSKEKGMPFITRTAWKNDTDSSEKIKIENIALNKDYG
jgi:MoaA/NifB/PqqE/SkfB family radical SAM enzyme